MAYIYKIINDINNKVYIGQTTLSVQERWISHLKSYKREKCSNFKIYRAMNKYGIEHFKPVLIEYCKDSLANDREMYYINKYNSFKDGYNSTFGGVGRAIIGNEAKSNIIYHWNNGLTIKEISCITKINADTISSFLYGKFGKELVNNIACKRATERRKIAVLMYDLNDNFIRCFNSIKEAYSIIKPNSKSGCHISDVCKGIRKSAYGFKWKYDTLVS